MRPHALTVDPRFALVIHRAKMQQHALARRFCRQVKAAAIPDRGHKILVIHAGKRALRAEGHQNFLGQLFLFHQPPGAAGSAMIDFKLPCAVQVHPAGAHELRPGIFGAGHMLHADPLLM